MADQVQQVKQKVDITSVIGSRLELKPAGKYVKGLCPFHSEKSPSFFVSPELQIFKCYGCGKSGDVFTFLQEYEGMNFREALEDLAEKVGVELTRYQPDSQEENLSQLKQILSLSQEYYHYLLTKHPLGQPGRDYLKKRKVSSALVQKFYLGYAPNSWHSLEQYLHRKKGFEPALVEQAGLLIKRQTKAGNPSFYDRFRQRLMFPLTDFRGQVVGFSGRTLDPEAKEAKYINTPETALYRKRELLFGMSLARPIIRKKDQIILVEGEFDVISSVGAGVSNIAGIKGSALTKEHVSLIMRLTKNIVLCLDADSAGEAATKRGIELADSMGVNVSVLPLREGKDPDELAQNSPDKWKNLIKQAEPIYDFYIESAFKQFNPETGVGKKQISAAIVPVLAKITNVVEQDHYLQIVSKKLNVRTESLREEIEKHHRSQELKVRGATQQKSAEPTLSEQTRLEKIEFQLWNWWLQLSQQQALEQLKILKRDWSQPGLERLHKELLDFIAKNQVFKLKEFVHLLPSELQTLVQRIYLDDVKTSQLTQEEIDALVAQANKLWSRSKIQQLTQEMTVLENKETLSEAESQQLQLLQKQVSLLIQQLHT